MKSCNKCKRLLSDVSKKCFYCGSSKIKDVKLPDKFTSNFSPISEVVLSDKIYSIEKILAKGGFGYVLKVKELRTDKYYAMKVPLSMSLWLEPMGVHDSRLFPDSEKMMEKEVSILSRLEHPGIVSIVDSGNIRLQYKGEDRRIPAYLMDLAVGDVEELMIYFSDISLDEKIKIIKEVATALAYLHRMGIVYRDMGLKNILIVDRGSQGIHYILSDFGTIKENIFAKNSSKTSRTVGTPRYLDPNYFLNTQKFRKDPRVDVYSLGVICTELLMGTHNWTENVDLKDRFITAINFAEQVVKPSLASSKIPYMFQEILIKSTAKNPNERFSDAEEFLNALYDVLESENINSTTKKMDIGVDGIKIPIISILRLPIDLPNKTFKVEEVVFQGDTLELDNPFGVRIVFRESFFPSKLLVKKCPSFYMIDLLPDGNIHFRINVEKAKSVLDEINSLYGFEGGEFVFGCEIIVT